MDRAEEPFASPHDPALLAAFVEGRLDERERHAMTVHLVACPDCRQALAMLARAAGVLAPAAKPRLVATPVWLALAATVLLATFAVRRLDGPIGTGVEPRPPSSGGGAAPSTPAPSAPQPAALEATPGHNGPSHDPMLDPGLLVKRGAGLRHAGGKSFRLVAREWVDTGFDATASLPTVLIRGPDERAAVVKQMPALRPYAALGDRVVVVFDGTVYRFGP